MIRLSKEEWKMSAKKEMNWLGKLCYYTGATKVYRVSDTYGDGLFRVWHPLTWLCFLILLVPCAVEGERISNIIKTKLPSYYHGKEDKGELEWM